MVEQQLNLSVSLPVVDLDFGTLLHILRSAEVAVPETATVTFKTAERGSQRDPYTVVTGVVLAWTVSNG